MNRLVSVCPGCGLVLPSPDGAMDPHYKASWACRELSGEVSAYTLSLGSGPPARRTSAHAPGGDRPLGDTDFIHQLVVDAYAAQHAGPGVKPIGIAFALIGLLLVCEHGYTGRQVQRAHSALAKRTKEWPRFEPPLGKARATVRDVVEAAPGDARNAMIYEWARSVWDVWAPEHERVRALWKRWG